MVDRPAASTIRRVAGPILFLGREDSPIRAHLLEVEPAVVCLGPSEPLTPELIKEHDPAFAVVHGYRVILRRPVLERLPDRVVNLHISYLPFNRGADPTLWSVIEDTPAGATIHYVDEGVDTGDVIVQRRVALADGDTLATAYAALQDALAELFRAHWPAIRAGTCPRTPQEGEGSSHRVTERATVEHLLTAGWDTPVGVLRGRLRPEP
jgi:methionyl-tRNA formyltransferase